MAVLNPDFEGLHFRQRLDGYENFNALQMIGQHDERLRAFAPSSRCSPAINAGSTCTFHPSMSRSTESKRTAGGAFDLSGTFAPDA